jgi:hypothetical protein
MNLFLVSFLFISLSQDETWGASATGRVTLRVVRPLSIQNVSDMVFPNAAQGADRFTLDPTAQSSAKFIITGEPGAQISVVLPGQTVLYRPDSPRINGIQVSDFVSSKGSTFILDQDGSGLVFIGATRDPIPTQQDLGDYTGTFQVEVVY